MEQSPSWESNSHSASQETPRLLWNPKVHDHVHKSPPVVRNLSQMNSVHKFPSEFPKIHSNIISLFMPKSSEWSLPFKYSDQNFVCTSHLHHACYMRRPSHLPLRDHPIIIPGEAYKLWSSSLRSLLQSPATFSLLEPNILLSTDYAAKMLRIRRLSKHNLTYFLRQYRYSYEVL
jgi:hypothetical protein